MKTDFAKGSLTRERLAVAAIVALAAFLRMGWPGITEFKADEARLFSLALDLAELKSLPACGIGSSVGLPNSPISVYLFALPLAAPFMRNPISGVLWVGLLNTLAVAACWWIARRYRGTTAALTAALLFATAPWAVIYSRKIWAQDLLPLFTLAYIGAGLRAFVEGRPRWIAAHFVLLALLVQIHLSAIALVPLTALLLVIFRRRLDWRWVGSGLALGVVALAPFAACGWARASGAGDTLARLAGQPASLTLDSFALAWLTTVGADTHSLAGPEAFREFLASIPNINPLLWLEGALVVGGGAYLFWHAIRRRGNRDAEAEAGLVIALWLIAPIIFFLRHNTPVFPHYFIILFPAAYLAAGAAIVAISDRASRHYARWLVPVVPIGIGAAQVGVFLVLLNFIATHATPGGFGTPVAMQSAVLREMRARMAEDGADEVLFVGEGDNPAVDEAPAVFDVLLRNVPHRFVDGRAAAVLPPRPAIVIIAQGDLPARDRYLAWAGGDARIESFQLRPGEGEYARLVLKPTGEVFPPHKAPDGSRLANGVEILGYDWRGNAAPGGEIAWEVWWRTGQPGADYHFFNHLVDANGARWGQEDGVSFPSNHWREGDRVISFFTLQISPDAPANPYWVRVGIYTYPDLTNVPVLDAAGNPAGDAVRIGPLAGR
ncbi:MAG: glycosyltransferase family 39 protein [Chloroflexi bacterium]|nr:glycosyltransferase family 39 protein [Chloroflexota bacterium]